MTHKSTKSTKPGPDTFKRADPEVTEVFGSTEDFMIDLGLSQNRHISEDRDVDYFNAAAFNPLWE